MAAADNSLSDDEKPLSRDYMPESEEDEEEGSSAGKISLHSVALNERKTTNARLLVHGLVTNVSNHFWLQCRGIHLDQLDL